MHVKKLAAVVAAAVLLFPLTACGGESDGAPQEKQTALNGDVFNSADVDFATGMIPHHAQALVMVDLTRGRDLSPEVRSLAEQIQVTQAREIEAMVDWLRDWDKPIPPTMRDHVHAEGHGPDGDEQGEPASEMPGMMTDKEMDALEAADGQRFEDMWLKMMIEHHRGAIEMAEREQELGVFKPAVKLAKSIESSQRAEIQEMENLL